MTSCQGNEGANNAEIWSFLYFDSLVLKDPFKFSIYPRKHVIFLYELIGT